MLCMIKKWKSLRNRTDARLVSNKKNYLKWTKPNYMSQGIFDNDLVAICKSKVTLTLNKQVLARVCRLDLSEVLLDKFQYDYVKNKYGNNTRLLFTSADSLIYEIKSDDVYEDFSEGKKMFDFSTYSDKSKYYDEICLNTN